MHEPIERKNSSLMPFIASLLATVVVVAAGYAAYSAFFKKKEISYQQTEKEQTLPKTQSVQGQTPDQIQQQAEEAETPVIPQPILEQDVGQSVPFEREPQQPSVKLYPMTVKTTPVSAELAETRQEQEQGLGGRTSLPEGRGLLYLLAKPDFYTFWMKNMKFPIDIIWVDKDQKIIDITHNLTPDTYPRIFQPVKPAQIILEVPAGFAKKNGIQIGDPVTVPKIQKN